MQFKTSLIAVALVFFMTAAIITVSPSSSAEPTGTWIDDGNYETDWYDDNESADSFYIENAADLAGLSYLTNRSDNPVDFAGKTIILPENGTIDLGSHHWIPINYGLSYFYGSINGRNCTIDGMTVSPTVHNIDDSELNTPYMGFIGKLVNNSKSVSTPVIQKINFTNVNLSPVGFGAGIVATVLSDATIRNCSVSGTMNLQHNGGEYASCSAGIVGSIEECENSTISIESCVNEMDIVLPNEATKGGTRIGGIVGQIASKSNVEITISDCTNKGDISGIYEVGGIVGYSNSSLSNVTITDCINSGAVNALGSGSNSAENAVGGIAGYSVDDAFIGCTNNGDVVAGSVMNNVGGIVGFKRTGSIEGCTNNGDIKGGFKTGGIAGYIVLDQQDQKTIVDDCLNAGDVSGQGHVGGIVGTTGFGSATGSSEISPFQINSCINTGNVTTTGDDTTVVGGIVGYNNYGSGNATRQDIQNVLVSCINTGSVPDGAGSLVGTNNSIKDTYDGADSPVSRPADITDCIWPKGGTGVANQTNKDTVETSVTGSSFDPITGELSTPIDGCDSIAEAITKVIGNGTAPDVFKFDVSFFTDHGTAPQPQSVTLYGAVELPAISAEGYVFVGWTCNGIEYEAGDSFIVTSDSEFTAVWEAKISLGVTIASQGGQDGSFTLTASVTGAPEGSQPSYQWYLDGDAIDGATSVTHTATTGGTYEVVATVTTDNQKVEAEATFELIIEDGGSTTVETRPDGTTVTTTTNEDNSSTVTTVSPSTTTDDGSTMTTTTVVEKNSEGIQTSSSIDVKIEINADSDQPVTVPSADLSTAVNGVNEYDESTITISVDAKASVIIPAEVADDLSGSNVELKITTSAGTVTMSVDVVNNLSSQMTDYNLVIDINDTVSNETDLNPLQQAVVGDNTVFELTATIGGSSVHELGGKVSYDVSESLVPGGIAKEDLVIFWVDDYGNLEVMEHEWVGETLRMWTDHFSYFVMGTASMIPEEPEPDYPVLNPDWDDDYPFVPPTVADDGDSDEMVKIVACAAAAAAVAIMAMFLVVDYRKK